MTTRIIENIKESGLVLLFGIVVIFATMLPMGCANMYDENGNLTEDTVEDYKYGEETASAIVSTVAPQYNWLVGAGSAIVGGALTLVGKTFYSNRKKKVS